MLSGVPTAITVLAVTHGAIRRVDSTAEVGVSWLYRGGTGGPDEQATRDDSQSARAPPAYSSTTSWPTTWAGCSWHLMGKTPALSAVNFTSLVLPPSTTSLIPNAAIS